MKFSRPSSKNRLGLRPGVRLVLRGAGIVRARPGKGQIAALVSRTAGGQTARRLLPVAFAAPLVLGWLCLEGQTMGLYTMGSGIALFAVVLLAVFVSMVYISGRSLAKAEVSRRATEEMLAASEAFYH